MFREAVDVSYWFLMPVFVCIGLVLAILLTSSAGSGQRSCCKRKSGEDEVSRVADEKNCNTDQNDPSKADEEDNLDEEASDFLAGFLTPMRPFPECHSRPYLYEPNHEKSSKAKTIAHVCFERHVNEHIFNTMTDEQVHFRIPHVSSPEFVAISVDRKEPAAAIQRDQTSVQEDEIQHNFSTSSEDTYQRFLPETLDFCGDSDSVMTYAKLRAVAGQSPEVAVVDYTSLKKQQPDSRTSATSGSLATLAHGDQDAYNYSTIDVNVYNYAISDCITGSIDTMKPSGESVTGPMDRIWHSCERRSEAESCHYSSPTLVPRDCDRAMSGIYDTIQEIKYHTVCTTSPASTKQQHDLKIKTKVEQNAAKRQTVMTRFDEKVLQATTLSEVY